MSFPCYERKLLSMLSSKIVRGKDVRVVSIVLEEHYPNLYYTLGAEATVAIKVNKLPYFLDKSHPIYRSISWVASAITIREFMILITNLYYNDHCLHRQQWPIFREPVPSRAPSSSTSTDSVCRSPRSRKAKKIA